MFFCDPFGHTGPEHLYNFGDDAGVEQQYIFMHDQEPIQIAAHRALFDDVVRRNLDMSWRWNGAVPGTVIVSEQGECVEQLEDIYGWQSRYYFFHGWACLDWYRGYDRTFLFSHPKDRARPTRSFMSPNRIIGGERDHRVLFMYHIIRLGLQHDHISAPYVCPVENQTVTAIAKRYSNRYHDIVQVLEQAELPWLFENEPTQQMTSCWLGNFAEAMDSLIYVPTETVYFGRRKHITEKTFKAIALGMPFILVAPSGSLEYMRHYGFQTFNDIWSENYDEEKDDFRRLELVAELLAQIAACSQKERNQIWRHVQPMITHNWNHFYRGGFESVLWSELTGMMNGL